MKNTECHCSGKDSALPCRNCNEEAALPYWCETCQQMTAEKRCPRCGLKTRKVR